MHHKYIILITIQILFSAAISSAGGLATTVYGCKLSRDSLGETFLGEAAYEDSYLIAFAVSIKEPTLLWNDRLQLEMEGQIVKHFRGQNHWEVNAVPVVLRWLPFPWDEYVDTSIAAGAGLSYATEAPKVESLNQDSPKFLGYLMFEVGFSMKQIPNWVLVTRLHHRSGANGTIGNALDASNSVGFGIRYNF